MWEVDFIKEMKDIGHSGELGDTSASNYALQLSTVREGHNSGRAYYLQTQSKEALDILMDCLQKNVKAAKKREEAQNAFRRVQTKVRKFYESKFFQSIIALLIGAVCATQFRSPRFRICQKPQPSDLNLIPLSSHCLPELHLHHHRVPAPDKRRPAVQNRQRLQPAPLRNRCSHRSVPVRRRARRPHGRQQRR